MRIKWISNNMIVDKSIKNTILWIKYILGNEVIHSYAKSIVSISTSTALKYLRI